MDEHKIQSGEESRVWIDADGVRLEGTLGMPLSALGIVIFAHGSGDSRHNARDLYVSRQLRRAGFATLLLDLLAPGEAATLAQGAAGPDVNLLGRRLVGATGWLAAQPATRVLKVGFSGAGTGAAAALIAAGQRGRDAFAVLARGGAADLAGHALGSVRAPTLLVVGGDDPAALEASQRALEALRAPAEVAVMPGGSHLSESADALERFAILASNWFGRHVARDAPSVVAQR